MDRIYRTVNIKDQETQHYYSHLIQHDARQRCPALIVLKEEHNNNNNNNNNNNKSDSVAAYDMKEKLTKKQKNKKAEKLIK